MIKYTSTSGKKSGVTAYEFGGDYITVAFGSEVYTYTSSLNSQQTIDDMIALALGSQGLSTYIAKRNMTLKFR